jgi:cysteine desulfurase
MIYADYNGSSQLNPDVKEHLLKRINNGPFANPNAIHSIGKKINLSLAKCRKVTARVVGSKHFQVIFNSGASEGISNIFYSCLKNLTRKTIVISSIEHSAVINVAKHYQEQGYKLEVVPVDTDGVINLATLKDILVSNKNDVAIVSIMAANNETGVIQPYKEIGKLCSEFHTPFFSDTTQFIGKADFNFEESEMDFAVFSSHKIGGIIGSGAMLIKDISNFHPIIFGGGQERGLRGGTQNYIGIETIAIALNSFEEHKYRLNECLERRMNFEHELKKLYPNIVIIGENVDRLASTTLVAYPGVHGQAVQIELESEDIFVTTSSACSDNEPNTSKVLEAMKIDDNIGRSVVRISLCLGQDPNYYKKIVKSLDRAYQKLSKLKSY